MSYHTGGLGQMEMLLMMLPPDAQQALVDQHVATPEQVATVNAQKKASTWEKYKPYLIGGVVVGALAFATEKAKLW